jgi:hypothetical protein
VVDEGTAGEVKQQQQQQLLLRESMFESIVWVEKQRWKGFDARWVVCQQQIVGVVEVALEGFAGPAAVVVGRRIQGRRMPPGRWREEQKMKVSRIEACWVLLWKQRAQLQVQCSWVPRAQY